MSGEAVFTTSLVVSPANINYHQGPPRRLIISRATPSHLRILHTVGRCKSSVLSSSSEAIHQSARPHLGFERLIWELIDRLVFTQPLIGNYGVPSSARDENGLLKYFESPVRSFRVVSSHLQSDCQGYHGSQTPVSLFPVL